MRNFLISWTAAWPTVTALLFILDELIVSWPMALRTLFLSGLMVWLMSTIVVPGLNYMLNRNNKGK